MRSRQLLPRVGSLTIGVSAVFMTRSCSGRPFRSPASMIVQSGELVAITSLRSVQWSSKSDVLYLGLGGWYIASHRIW